MNTHDELVKRLYLYGVSEVDEVAYAIERLQRDNNSLRNNLAAAKQDAAAAWERHAMVNRINNKTADDLAESRRDLAALRSDIEAHIAIAKEACTRAANWERMLRAVTTEIYSREYSMPWRRTENAPGHCHEIPGIWDSDNGRKAGKTCAWCLVWNEARAALAQVKEGS